MNNNINNNDGIYNLKHLPLTFPGVFLIISCQILLFDIFIITQTSCCTIKNNVFYINNIIGYPATIGISIISTFIISLLADTYLGRGKTRPEGIYNRLLTDFKCIDNLFFSIKLSIALAASSFLILLYMCINSLPGKFLCFYLFEIVCITSSIFLILYYKGRINEQFPR